MAALGAGRRLLGREEGFRLLFLAMLASSVGTWLAVVALVIDVYDRTGSASWVSALLIAEFAPLAVIGLLAGPLIDRLPRRRLLVVSDLMRAAIFAVIPFCSSSLQIVLCAMLVGAATSIFRPALYAGLPNLVDGDDLPRANGMLLGVDNLALALGPLLGGILVAWAGTAPAYGINAVSYVVSALLILRIRGTLEQGPGGSEGHWRDLFAGLALVRRVRALRAVVVTWTAVMAGSAGISVAEVVLAKDVFDAGDLGYGVMVSAMGAGLVLGSLVGTHCVDRYGVRHTYAVAIGLLAVGIGAASGAPGVWATVPLLVVAGTGNGAALVANALLVQRGVPDHQRGRAFTVAMSLSYAALGAGMVVAGPLTEALGARQAWAIAAGVIALAVPLAILLTRGIPSGADAAAPAVDPLVERPRVSSEHA